MITENQSGSLTAPSISTAMILAAGRGERLRPITDHTPKPLVDVGGESLLQRHFFRLIRAGIKRVVINVAHLHEQIVEAVRDMSPADVEVRFSEELEGRLETAGGILQALPLIGDEEFLVVNADIWTDFEFKPLLAHDLKGALTHLVMVDTPGEKGSNDFYLSADGWVNCDDRGKGLTFSGISLMSRGLFDGLPQGRRALRPVLEKAIAVEKVSGEHYQGQWFDIGTVERLEIIRKLLA